MALIERIGRPQVRLYLVAWGRLTEEDEGRLLARVLTAPHADVTVDLCEVEEVTDRGCTAIKNVAAYMGQDQTMEVLYVPDREATRSLERTGIADDRRIVLVPSSLSRRVNV
jgi:anti-sigma-K factor RskA